MSVEATVLDFLRQIFPKLDDHVLSTCIRKVRETARSKRRPATYIFSQECVNRLLDENKDVNDSLTNRLPEHSDVSFDSRLDYDHNDVVFASSNCAPKVIGNASNVRKNTSSILNTLTPTPYSQNAGETVSDPRRYLSFETPTSTKEVSRQEVLLVSGVEVQTVFVEQDPTQEALKIVQSIIPDVNDDYALSLLNKWPNIPPDKAANNVCDKLLGTRHYPRKSSTPSTQSATVASESCDSPKIQFLKCIQRPQVQKRGRNPAKKVISCMLLFVFWFVYLFACLYGNFVIFLYTPD